jgi:hypothetical protein
MLMHCPHTSTPQQHSKGKEASAAKERKTKHDEKRPKTTKSKNFFFFEKSPSPGKAQGFWQLCREITENMLEARVCVNGAGG